MDASRRALLSAGLGASAVTLTNIGAHAGRQNAAQTSVRSPGQWVALEHGPQARQSKALQDAIDHHALAGEPLLLPPGKFHVANIELRTGSKLIGAAGLTEFVFSENSAFFTADHARDITLIDISFNGNDKSFAGNHNQALLSLSRCQNLQISDCTIRKSKGLGIDLDDCSGRIEHTTVEHIQSTGIFTNNARGLDIVHNNVRACGDNGIQVWRDTPGHDGTRVSHNRISNIKAKSGGSGQYGNAINVFRAGSVSVTDNHISDCAYSAVRGNSASNLQIISNACHNLGEVALYAEFAFEGAQICNNLVANAATGISVANFNEGGRLATVTGNLIRTLNRREFEPVDKRGVGIFVEADSVVANNIIEDAPTAGLHLGWGKYRRDLLATQNIIRNATIGILVSADSSAGPTLIDGNLISGSRSGAIRKAHFDHPVGPDLVNETYMDSDLRVTGNFASLQKG